jgi:hypothetical protein
MTTPLPSEPMPSDGQVPYLSTLVDRLYQRLPEVYRVMDARDFTYPLKRYLGAAMHQAGLIDDTVTAIAGEDPIGPPTPEPWSLSPDDLARWRASRRTRPSALADPDQADPSWLPWLAQLVGATLDPAASDTERRDTIRYATSGWRAGTRQAIADAARTALTGTQFAKVMPHTIPAPGGGTQPGDVWDVTVVTRVAETPDPDAVLGAILRKGVKPAGVVLHHTAYTSTWDLLEAKFPTWADIETATWAQIEEAGISYAAVPGNLFVNPSFELDASGWSARTNTTIGRITGGVDGVGALRTTATAAGNAEFTEDGTAIAPGDHVFSISIQPTGAHDFQWSADFYAAGVLQSTATVDVGTLPAGEWTRIGGQFTAPTGTDQVRVWVQGQDLAADEYFDADAAFLRRVT